MKNPPKRGREGYGKKEEAPPHAKTAPQGEALQNTAGRKNAAGAIRRHFSAAGKQKRRPFDRSAALHYFDGRGHTRAALLFYLPFGARSYAAFPPGAASRFPRRYAAFPSGAAEPFLAVTPPSHRARRLPPFCPRERAFPPKTPRFGCGWRCLRRTFPPDI